jgi:zinc transport system substrate-binding protein
MKKIIVILGILLFLLSSGCQSHKEKKPVDDGKLKVVVSFNAMKEFTAAVGGPYIHIISLVPEGVEPHGFQPTSDQMKEIHDASVLVVHGLGMEPWTKKVAEAANNPKLVVVEASHGIDAIALKELGKGQEAYDPHAWLSLKNAQKEVQNIAEALGKADPPYKEEYLKNADDYQKKLEKLYTTYRSRLGSAAHQDFVTGHAAFAYLCRDFGLHMSSIESVFAEGEPSAKELTRLLDYCKSKGIRTIFTETGVSPKVSETLAKEIGAQTVPIYTMETSENGKSYLERMQSNLQRIAGSLGAP